MDDNFLIIFIGDQLSDEQRVEYEIEKLVLGFVKILKVKLEIIAID